MTRKLHDKYYTSLGVTKAFLNAYEPLKNPSYDFLKIYEPCAGGGAMVNAIKQHLPYSTILTNDISPDKSFSVGTQLDATKLETYDTMKEEYGVSTIDWCITNPPFNCAFDILKASWNKVEIGVALLLRLTFLEPTKERAKFLIDNPPTSLYILGSPRPSYTSDGRNDSTTTAWMVWLKNKNDKRSAGIHMLTNNSLKW